jgi:hypothetical protein
MVKSATAISLAILFIVSTASNLLAQTDQPAASNPPPLEAQITKSIVFITLKVKVNGKVLDFKGTGFLVGVPDARLPAGQLYPYLVTNRHVAEALDNKCKHLQLNETYISRNLKVPVNGNRVSKEPLPLSSDRKWHFPDDPSTDLAVYFLPQISTKYDEILIPMQYMLTTEELAAQGVMPGEKVMTFGLFSQHPGVHGLQPMVRQGILAMVPDAPMRTTTCAPGNLYLADVHIIPGNSGSPVFLMPTRSSGGVTLNGERNVFALLGVISGYMFEDQNLELQASTSWSAMIHGNSGIATVVPAEQLKALLLTPEVKRERDEFIANSPASRH